MFYSWIRAKQIEILERQWKLPAPLRQPQLRESSPPGKTMKLPTETARDSVPESERE
jgi:hypothetical protein